MQELTATPERRVIRLCERWVLWPILPPEDVAPRVAPVAARTAELPRILVLGGTGFIGKELVRQLIASGRTVRLLVRSAAGIPEELRTPELEWQSRRSAQSGGRAARHGGSGLRRSPGAGQREDLGGLPELEIEATRQVAECALEAGVKRFIYTGTIDSYYAGRRAGTITEATPLDPRIERRNLYARAKAASEEILMRMHRERGLPLVIVRPGIVIGRGGSPFHWGVGMWWHDAVCQIWGDGNNKLPLVLVEDVARGLIAAMETPGIEGRAFNLVGDPCLSAQEYLDELDRAGGMRIQRYATPIWRFYLQDMMKWMVKVAVRHPERRLPQLSRLGKPHAAGAVSIARRQRPHWAGSPSAIAASLSGEGLKNRCWKRCGSEPDTIQFPKLFRSFGEAGCGPVHRRQSNLRERR